MDEDLLNQINIQAMFSMYKYDIDEEKRKEVEKEELEKKKRNKEAKNFIPLD